MIDRHAAGEVDHPALGGRVGGEIAGADKRELRGNVDDHAALALDHVWKRLTGKEVYPLEVGVDNAVPPLLRGVHDVGDEFLTGAIDKYVELAELPEGVAHHP